MTVMIIMVTLVMIYSQGGDDDTEEYKMDEIVVGRSRENRKVEGRVEDEGGQGEMG